ncbi:hypothetical protein F0562_016409 [Nyssa sinensis]|uniref:adenylate kinase n=1 Tax=Nyssa sinensis TaxID=561372 RepID=A0A5J4ZNN0_9ASTE|nr:hypothetical protein F0562_016409 [Nyssa sinensis]
MAAINRLLKPSPFSSFAITCIRRSLTTAVVSETDAISKSQLYPHNFLPPRVDPKGRNVQWVFLGSPGVGKGTYSSRLSTLLGVPHIATGDLVREELSSNGPLSKQLAEIVNQGKLVSDEIILSLLSKRLEAGEAKGESGFILDGFPRTIRQAEILDEVTDIDLVVNLKLPEDILVEKCLGRRICSQCGKNFNVASINVKGENGSPGISMAPLLPPPQCASKLITRSDDTEAVVKERLLVYNEKSQPVEDFYRIQGKLLEFDLPGGIPESWPSFEGYECFKHNKNGLKGSVSMTIDGEAKRDLPEVNRLMQDEVKKAGDRGIVGKGQGASVEEELRINRIGEDVKDGGEQMVQDQAVLQVPQLQQQSQGSVACWERFLHLRSIKVLLVETDDSTRHVVTALLRNCNYEVIEAANGLQAWRILENLTIDVDLVLTEVVMPCLTGIGLLCKIMSHKTRNNIPVIMMSSHDSMGLVFKCLSEGAVDFLVKPIRKNELKNLWQHVWRRCHSSSAGSNDGDDNGSIGLNTEDGSDNGSGTQGSWTKQAVEVDSSQSMSSWDQIADCPDSTCAQVIRSNAEASGNKWLHMTSTKEFQEQKEQCNNVAMGKEMIVRKSKSLDLQPKNPIKVLIKPIGTKQNTLPEFGKQIDKGLLNASGDSPSNKYEAVITNTSNPQMDSRESEAPRELGKISEINYKADNGVEELPVIERSLKRLRGLKDSGTTVQDDCKVLRRSELSAFSRYNTASNACKAPIGITGSSSPLDSVEVVKKESICNIRSHSNGNPPYQSSNVGSNDIDMFSTTNKVFTYTKVLKDKSKATSAVNDLHPLCTFQHIKGDVMCNPQQVILVKADDMAATAVLAPPRGSHLELYHHHFPDMDQQKPLCNHANLSLEKVAADAPHCGISKVLGGPVEGNAENWSLNRSVSGSNHGSNGENRSSTVVNAGGTNMESDNGLAGKSGSGDASGSGSGNRVELNKYAQRVAALAKFRQKRKERCFQKKVRYQSRKRLAEQRPRVQGQFARQTGQENSNRNADRAYQLIPRTLCLGGCPRANDVSGAVCPFLCYKRWARACSISIEVVKIFTSEVQLNAIKWLVNEIWQGLIIFHSLLVTILV